jgi:hypothetical protein
MEFEWDVYKAEDNLQNHRVSFDEASEVFDDPAVWVVRDELHSETEERLIAVGRTLNFRLLAVVYTMRGEIARIISARDATARETREYEQAQ